jgi:hypothetical protein
LENDVLTFRPSVVTTCYGMNDGNYTPPTQGIADAYRKAMTSTVQRLKAGGVRTIIVGSPGAVDEQRFRQPRVDGATYNKALAGLRDVTREIATAEGVLFADVHAVMMEAMSKAKAAYGEAYVVAPDGIHPMANGHLAMAYAFLMAMGVDGEIGTLTVDYSTGEAGGTQGHKIGGYSDGTLSVESTRYPFCFPGKASSTTGALAMTAFLPFNEELNRYRLVVKNAPALSEIKWGASSKEFTAAQLDAGINLAVEFPQNPFVAPFTAASAAMLKQQEFEGQIKGRLNIIGQWRADMPEGGSQYDALRDMIVSKSEGLRDTSRAGVVPVVHQLTITAVASSK